MVLLFKKALLLCCQFNFHGDQHDLHYLKEKSGACNDYGYHSFSFFLF